MKRVIRNAGILLWVLLLSLSVCTAVAAETDSGAEETVSSVPEAASAVELSEDAPPAEDAGEAFADIFASDEATTFSWRNSENGNTVSVRDGAGLLKKGEAGELLDEMKDFTEYGSLAFVSRGRTDGYQGYITYAQDRTRELVGNNGALFLIDMRDRKVYICTTGSTRRVLTNSRCRTITDNVYKDASRGEYFRCASRALSQIGSVMKGERIAQPMRLITSILLGLLVGIFINFILVRKSRVLVDEDSSVTVGDPSEFESSDAEITVYKRVSNESSGGGSGGGGGGGGGSFGGGGHSF